MAGRTARTLTIQEVRARFEHWRQNRKGKAAIPDELWLAAMELARNNGVNPTASELHLDGSKLKRLMIAAGTVPEKKAPPSFVELIAPERAVLPECSVELESRRGKLRIQLKGSMTTDLAELSRMLWDLAS